MLFLHMWGPAADTAPAAAAGGLQPQVAAPARGGGGSASNFNTVTAAHMKSAQAASMQKQLHTWKQRTQLQCRNSCACAAGAGRCHGSAGTLEASWPCGACLTASPARTSVQVYHRPCLAHKFCFLIKCITSVEVCRALYVCSRWWFGVGTIASRSLCLSQQVSGQW